MIRLANIAVPAVLAFAAFGAQAQPGEQYPSGYTPTVLSTPATANTPWVIRFDEQGLYPNPSYAAPAIILPVAGGLNSLSRA